MNGSSLQLDGYDEIELIGQGGLGDVYRARRRSTGGLVALKVIRAVAGESSVRRRVDREVAALVQLKGHAFVVHVEEVLHTPTGPVVVMEYASNGSLADLVEVRGRLAPADYVFASTHVSMALRDAHQRGIIHRDVKPHNLLVGEFGQVKVCDFGIAAVALGGQERSRTNALSYRYASPEELQDRPDVGPATDVYSLGVTIRHLATGHAPRHPSVPEPNSWLAGLIEPTDRNAATATWRLVERMLEDSPSARPSMGTVVEELEQIAHALGDRRVRALHVTAEERRGERHPDPPETDDPTIARGPARPSDRSDSGPWPAPSRMPTGTGLPTFADAPEKWW